MTEFEIMDVHDFLARGDELDRINRSVVRSHDCRDDDFDHDHHRDDRWHGWELCSLKPAVLGYDGYWLDLTDHMQTPAKALDITFQIQGKGWTDDGTHVTGFMQAIEDIINPQATLCSLGRGRRLSRSRIQQLAEKFVADWR